MSRISFLRMHQELVRVLRKFDFSADRADTCARLFSEASLDGVYSHGLNRFPRFVEYIRKGYINVDAIPEKIAAIGVIEQWDGNLGPGNLNAQFCMDRALSIAKTNGMGLVALRNTNHWMRGGAYGWQAAEAGFIGICFTNTQPNMPPWGAKNAVLGNNPLIIALPAPDHPIVLDTAMTQFSFGKIEAYRREGKLLPVPGGFDTRGELTVDPGEIEKSWRALPFGFWKGSGLSLVLDLVASVLSGGMCTVQVGEQGSDEYGLSQVFLAIDPHSVGDPVHYQEVIKKTLMAVHDAEPAREGEQVYYPGERTIQTRKYNIENGIPVDDRFWEEICAM
ncbi:MAG: 3-dehydro-L-gulonate 2-dehydrogenase [Bacteroidia bacterium]